jgi:sigma-B regulation protein RsbU (phosphoserine phosphatase)
MEKSKGVSKEEWQEALGVHNLFKRINNSVINEHKETSPIDLLSMAFEPFGMIADAVVTLYPNSQSRTEYFLRMYHIGTETKYNLDIHNMPVGKGGFLKRASAATEPMLVPDITPELEPGDFDTLPWLASMRTALVVPTISLTGNMAATIIFAREPDAFKGPDLKSNMIMVYAMTNVVLTLILRIEADKARDALNEELASVGRIQREFLPKVLPDTEELTWAVYYATSACAGGDYYDFFDYDDARQGFIIADVSGHGSPAAIVMSMTRLLLHTLPADASSPDAVFEYVNRLLVGNLLLGQFVTAFYCIIDTATGVVEYSNAGHCPPQVFRASTKTIETLTTTGGLPLGVTDNGGYVICTAELKPGDVFVFYTDGIREAMNSKGEMYGEMRLQSVLLEAGGTSAEEVKNEILRDVCEFCAGEQLKDDLTIVVLTVKE